MTNRYICDARISERKFKELLKMFCADVTALTASKLVAVNRKTGQRVYEVLRRRVVELATHEARPFPGEVEIDESYFGARRVRGKRGRGAARKTPVIGLLKRGGKVFTEVVKNWLQGRDASRSSRGRCFRARGFTPMAGSAMTACF